MSKSQLVALALLLVLFVTACAPAASPTPAQQVPAPAVVSTPTPVAPSKTAVAAKSAWEQEWETLVATAKREGVLSFGTSAGGAVRRALSEAFQAKYGIRVESTTGSVGTVSSKIVTERRAGLYLWDAVVAGATGQATILKPAGATSPLEPAFLLPDLSDPASIKRVWFQGKLPWVDKEHHLTVGLLFPSMDWAINTSLVKPGEVKVWDDLLDPKWKGKIAIVDPTQPGTICDGQIMPMLYELKGESWVRKLAAQEPAIVADERLGIDWLAHGKFPIYIPPRPDALLEFGKAGAPIKGVIPEDVIILSAGPSGVSLIDKASHPSVAKLFINWYLSNEGQTVLSKVWLGQSAREDVSTAFLPSDAIRKPGANYWIKDREEVAARVVDGRAKSKEIFGYLMK